MIDLTRRRFLFGLAAAPLVVPAVTHFVMPRWEMDGAVDSWLAHVQRILEQEFCPLDNIDMDAVTRHALKGLAPAQSQLVQAGGRMTATIIDLTQRIHSRNIEKARASMHLIRMDTMSAWQSELHRTVMGPMFAVQSAVNPPLVPCELVQLPCDSEPA